MNYELFNFGDPIEEAVETLVAAGIPADIDVTLPRSDEPLKDTSVQIRFADGQATGHKFQTPYLDWVYDLYAGGTIEIELRQVRYTTQAATVDEAADTTSRDTLGLLAGKVRFALREASADSLNAQLTSPKISAITPLAGERYIDDEMIQDVIVLRYSINYGIPKDVWANVILTESGFVIKAEDGTELVADE